MLKMSIYAQCTKIHVLYLKVYTYDGLMQLPFVFKVPR